MFRPQNHKNHRFQKNMDSHDSHDERSSFFIVWRLHIPPKYHQNGKKSTPLPRWRRLRAPLSQIQPIKKNPFLPWGHQKLIQYEGFKTKLLKYEPEGDKSTMGRLMVPFFSSNSEKKHGFRLLSKNSPKIVSPQGG